MKTWLLSAPILVTSLRPPPPPPACQRYDCPSIFRPLRKRGGLTYLTDLGNGRIEESDLKIARNLLAAVLEDLFHERTSSFLGHWDTETVPTHESPPHQDSLGNNDITAWECPLELLQVAPDIP